MDARDVGRVLGNETVAGSVVIAPSALSSLDRPESPVALPPQQLYRPADLSALPFQTTAELEPVDWLVGQERALGAIKVATGI